MLIISKAMHKYAYHKQFISNALHNYEYHKHFTSNAFHNCAYHKPIHSFALLMISIVVHCIAYDKHSCAMHWN